MRLIPRLMCRVVLVGLPVAATNAAPPADDLAPRLERFEGIIERLMRDLGTPGLSAIILNDQEVVWARGFGYADAEHGVAATPDTVYGLASVTKALASVVFFRNVERGLLDLDDPATQFDAFANPQDYPNADEIRLRHLMSHTSLPPAGTIWLYDGNRYCGIDKAIALASGRSLRTQFMEEIAGPLGMRRTAPNPIDAEISDRFRAYCVAHDLDPAIRDTDGKPYDFAGGYDYRDPRWGRGILLFEALVARALDTTPYGAGLYERRREMPVDPVAQQAFDDFWLATPEQAVYRQLARGYHYDEHMTIAPTPYPQFFSAGAGFNSTVRDLAKFDIALDRGELITSASKAIAWEPVRSPTGDVFPYGYGWFTADYAGRRIVWHGGAWTGMSCMYLKVPEDDLTFIVLSNSKIQSDAFDMARGDALNSAFGLAFLRLFVYEPLLGAAGPDIDWRSAPETIVAQIASVGDEPLQALYRRELDDMLGMYVFMQEPEMVERLLNEVRPRFTPPFHDPWADAEVIAAIVDVGNHEDRSTGFTLDRPAQVRIYAIGEVTEAGAFDYGWIEDSAGRTVWTMADSTWAPAGGSEKNRVANVIVDLPTGDYVLRYVSDDSHAAGAWNALPPDHWFWGIRVLREVAP